jgi:hypothetical protein
MTTTATEQNTRTDPVRRTRRDTPPKHGPYGRAEQVGGRWVVRLTAEGQRVVTEWLADIADLTAYLGTCFPGVLAYARAARMSDDEIDAACRRGACVAAAKWHPARCPSFGRVAAKWMRSAVQRDADKLTKCHRQTGRGEVFDRPTGEKGQDTLLGEVPDRADDDGRTDRADRRAKIMTELRRLPERDRLMFGLLHGLADGKPLTLREVAEVYGVTHQRVQQVCKRVAERLTEACGGRS